MVSNELKPRIKSAALDGWHAMPFVDKAKKPVLTDLEKERSFLLFTRLIIEPIYKNTKP
jgi:hypothetical protein